jgi:hypothetical protein
VAAQQSNSASAAAADKSAKTMLSQLHGLAQLFVVQHEFLFLSSSNSRHAVVQHTHFYLQS